MTGKQVERRLAAILAADVVGYSRLTGDDEEGTLEALNAVRRELGHPKIAEHRGRIVRTTGDGLLIEFASVVDAVRCAVEVQREMIARNAAVPTERRIEFRMGINIGDIIIEDGDIFGDGVNIAARLEALAEPGGICVSAAAHEQVRDRLDIAFADLGEQQVKNIARPVRVYSVGSRPSSPDVTRGFQFGGMLPIQAPAAPPLPDKPSVAVLPFANMSSDPEQEFLADGIAEDVITALSRYPSLFVIARTSTLTYKGRAVEVRQIGRELGVRYVLEGSLRKAGDRIRVTAQLIEAETGNHVWAEHYDRDLSDIFAVQDEITESVTIAIAPAIAQAEQQRAMRKPPESLNAWSAYQRGLWHLAKGNVGDLGFALNFFQQAIELDPNFAGGYHGFARSHLLATDYGLRSFDEARQLAEPLARRAVALDGADAEAHADLAMVLWARGDLAGAQAEAERALTLSPNLASAHAVLGAAFVFSGRQKDGAAALEKSIRLDPRGPRSASGLNQIVISYYFRGNYETTLELAERAIRLYPEFPLFYRWRAAALGQLGRTDQAKQALTEAIAISPASFDLYVRNRAPWMRPEDHARMLDGLRKAGWEG